MIALYKSLIILAICVPLLLLVCKWYGSHMAKDEDPDRKDYSEYEDRWWDPPL